MRKCIPQEFRYYKSLQMYKKIWPNSIEPPTPKGSHSYTCTDYVSEPMVRSSHGDSIRPTDERGPSKRAAQY